MSTKYVSKDVCRCRLNSGSYRWCRMIPLCEHDNNNELFFRELSALQTVGYLIEIRSPRYQVCSPICPARKAYAPVLLYVASLTVHFSTLSHTRHDFQK